MELHPGTANLIDALRGGAGTDLTVPAVREVRPESVRTTTNRPVARPADEVLVRDHRAGVSPAQSVEHKLSAMLRGGAAAIPVSHFRLAKLCRKG